MDKNPALRSFQVAAISRLEDLVRDHIATRTGTDPSTHMYPWLVAAAAGTAVRSALRLWEHSGGRPDHLPELIEEAFNEISAGLPAPLPPGQGPVAGEDTGGNAGVQLPVDRSAPLTGAPGAQPTLA